MGNRMTMLKHNSKKFHFDDTEMAFKMENLLYAVVLPITFIGSFSSFLAGCWSANSSRFSSWDWSNSDKNDVKFRYNLLVSSSFCCFSVALILAIFSIYILRLMWKIVKGGSKKI
jgi:hypothetical protein